ncbi:MAG TPA: ribosome maturation factor RimP [Clostridia bacterium]|nr:ribosome maturation factor RimP [Clostridia bacterium]
MSKVRTEDIVSSLLLPVIKELGFELVDVEFVKEGPHRYLRLFIDHPDGVDLKACETVSRAAELLLDEKDPISESYILEVSSPGLTRPLKKEADFQRCLGQRVVVNTYVPVEGRKSIEGVLEDFDQDTLVLKEDRERVVIPRNKVSLAHRAVEF